MEPFRIQHLSSRIVRITGPMHENIYLVKGDERAALIDSGSGFGSLRRVVDGLTALPLTVLFTHGHMDHAMGAGEFGEVRMNPQDIPVFCDHARPDYRRAFLRVTCREKADTLPMVPAADPGQFRPLADGDSFDLGGLHLDVFGCPGHTPGSVCLLCENVLFSVAPPVFCLLPFQGGGGCWCSVDSNHRTSSSHHL